MDTPAPASQAVDQNALAEIQGMKPWLRFMSILGFIGSGMCVLAAVGMVGAAALIPTLKSDGDHWETANWMMLLGMAVLYALFALPYLLISLHLHRAANTAGDVLERPTAENLTAFLTHHRKFWKFIGIMTIAVFFLYTIAIIAAVVIPAIAQISKK